MKNSYIFGVICAFTGGVFWGFSGACGQFLFLHKNVGADWLVPYRLLLSGVFMMIFYFFRLKFAIFRPFQHAKNLFPLAIFSLIGLMMTQYSYFRSIELSNAAVATVIQYTAPILILALVCLRQRRAPSRREILALVFAVLGVFLLATHCKFDALVITKEALFWCALSAVCVVFYNLSARALNEKYGVGLVLAWGLLVGGVVLALKMRVWEMAGAWDLGGVGALCGVVFLGTIAAFSLYLKGVLHIGAERASFIAAIEPVSAALFSVFWLGTELIWLDYAGFFCIIVCIVMLRKK